MTYNWELAISACIVVGALFMLVGSYGLLRLPDMMTRLHAPTKATTVGVGAILVASMLHSLSISGKLSVNELLITFFLYGTAPISAHFMARAYLHTQCKDPQAELPDTCCQCGWSVFEPEQAEPSRVVTKTSNSISH